MNEEKLFNLLRKAHKEESEQKLKNIAAFFLDLAALRDYSFTLSNLVIITLKYIKPIYNDLNEELKEVFDLYKKAVENHNDIIDILSEFFDKKYEDKFMSYKKTTEIMEHIDKMSMRVDTVNELKTFVEKLLKEV